MLDNVRLGAYLRSHRAAIARDIERIFTLLPAVAGGEGRKPIDLLAIASGLDGKQLLAEASDARLVAREAELTREAIDRPLFGAPFYFIRSEPFWGQDRLDHLEQAIVLGRSPILPPAVSEV